MAARVISTTLLGAQAVGVEVEAQVSGGLRRFSIVGLPDGVIRESKDRVRCAIQNSGFSFPDRELVVSFAPAGLQKSGAGFDLATALAILAADGQVRSSHLDDSAFLGELCLDGRIKATPGALAAACFAKSSGLRRLFISADDCWIAELVDGVEITGVASLSHTVSLLDGTLKEESLDLFPATSSRPVVAKKNPDFSDVIGHQECQRALQLAAAGGHNVLMVGPAGGGKSMLAQRLLSILPELTNEEIIEISNVYAAFWEGVRASDNSQRFILERPFRAPHHSISSAGLVGGGSQPVPGEISLAHRGVLFLDEIGEFQRSVLEMLREPLENRQISISRAKARLNYPADFILIAAMNPEKGVKLGDAPELWSKKISKPILDRIDMKLWVSPLPPQALTTSALVDHTARLRQGVVTARNRQRERFQDNLRLNGQMTALDLRQLCLLQETDKRFVEQAATKLRLSARGYLRMLKLARTIADVEGSKEVEREHLAEALSLRVS